jgi:DNA-binding winged helix-turn-helix (wHTH) protein
MRFSFGSYSLDAARRELHDSREAVSVEPQVFDLLEFLIRNRDRVVSRDDLIESVWNGRIVSESTLATRINAARRAIGDDGAAQKLIKTIARKGFRFVGDVRDETTAFAQGEPAAPSQKVSFCKTSDGVNLAVATVGEGPALVKTANWLNHLENDWQSPIWSPMLQGSPRDLKYPDTMGAEPASPTGMSRTYPSQDLSETWKRSSANSP